MPEQNNNNVRTSTLLRRLFKASNLNSFIEENEYCLQTTPFHEYISRLCQKMGCIPEQIIKQTTIERTYGHQIFNGTRSPSRDKVIQLAFGFGLDVDGAQELLKVAHKTPLHPKIKRDAAVLYCISHHMSEMTTQNILLELKLTLLGGTKDG